MNKAITSLIMTSLLCLGACSPGHNNYSQYHTVDSEGWAYDDTLEFIPAIADSTATGKLAVTLRHTNSYPYSNIWLEILYPTPADTLDPEKADTLNITLSDKYGHWHGRGMGLTFQLADTVYRDFTVYNGAPIRLRHIMRVDTVTGIEQIGISFTPMTK